LGTMGISSDERPFSYTARLAEEIELKWQDQWAADGTSRAPNPVGELVGDPVMTARPKKYILDMFPYP
jgi:leucyl-tRNA synthetase